MSIFGRRNQDDDAPDEVTQPITPVGEVIGFQTVMGADTELEGSLTCVGNVRLDGKFKGTLDIEGNILVGEQADIRADIEARNISIAGNVHGNVHGKRVQLLRTACVWGDIDAGSLTMEEGAFIDGKIVMKNRPRISGRATQTTTQTIATMPDTPTIPIRTEPDADLSADVKPTKAAVTPSMVEPPVRESGEIPSIELVEEDNDALDMTVESPMIDPEDYMPDTAPFDSGNDDTLGDDDD